MACHTACQTDGGSAAVSDGNAIKRKLSRKTFVLNQRDSRSVQDDNAREKTYFVTNAVHTERNTRLRRFATNGMKTQSVNNFAEKHIAVSHDTQLRRTTTGCECMCFR
jgi:hypothetical protein